MPIAKAWTAKCRDKAAKEVVERQLAEAQPLLRLTVSVIEDKLSQADRNRFDKGGYDRPSWALEQADIVGEMRGYRKVIELLKNSLT